MTPKQSIGDRFFAGLLRLLPFDFRSEFGSEMEEVFREQRAATAGRRGAAALLKMWATTIADIFRMAPREHLTVLAQDARYAARMMRRNLGYTTAAVLILGLGIGVNTSIFSAVYNVLLKPLPYLQGEDLVVLRQPALKTGSENIAFSVREIEDYRQRNHSLTGIVEYHGMSFTLFGGAEPRRVRTGVVSANFFEFFGVKPLMGRAFVADDERAGAPAVLVVSYEYWRKVEGGDPSIVGRVYQLNDRPHTVIGVLPPIPQYPNENDVYMPTSACPTRSAPRVIASRTFRMMSLFGRLKPNTTAEFCRRDLAGVAQQIKQDYPAAYPENLGMTAAVANLREDLTKQARPMLLALLGAAAFVLLIACANVANLMLARMARREQELTIRTAVGAGSGRLLRQLLTESFLLALLATAVGVALAYGSSKLLVDFSGQFTPRAREIGLNGWVLGFAALCATATTVIFGSMAALYARGDLAGALKDGARSSADRRRAFARSALIAAQVAFSFVLLTGAGLMVRSFLAVQAEDAGFVPERVFAIRFNLNWAKYNDPKHYREISRRILERVEAQPGVAMAAIASALPMDPDVGPAAAGRPLRFVVQGDPRTEAESPIVRASRAVTPDYFKTVGIPLMAGRPFNANDKADGPQVLILSRALAAKRWPNESAVGRRISFDGGDTWNEVVGVVGDVKEYGLAQDAPYEVYGPLEQSPRPSALVARSVGDPAAIAGLLRQAVMSVDPETAISRFETLEQSREASVSPPRTLARLFGGFAGLAFVIAVAGITSMLALWVRQRKREIGIRMALGASPKLIVGEVVRKGMLLAGIGLTIGVVGALQVTRWLKAMLFRVGPTDVPTYTVVAALLLGAALLACLAPARKASRIDPQEALRSE
jgi:putative ABC transport system permease protein